MTPFTPLYSARNRKEYDELEKAWKTLLQSYSFVVSSGLGEININVRKDDIADSIDMSPKTGKIERIVLVEKISNPIPALIRDMSPETVRLRIGETHYRIWYEARSE